MDEQQSEESAPRPRLVWLRRLARIAVIVPGALLLALTLLSLGGPAAWWLDLLTHFRPQFAMGLLLVVALQFVARPRLLVAAWATGALLNALFVAPLYFAQVPAATGESLTISHCNTGGDGVDIAVLADWLRRTSPDLLSLQEVTPRNLPRIETGLREAGLSYELIAAEARNDTRGVALFSRRAGIDAEIIRPVTDHDRPMIQANLDLSGMPVAILGFHATRPAPARPYRNQAQGMHAAVFWSSAFARVGSERLLIGDFNSTSQGALVSDLCRRADLADARRGHGLAGTWPASLPAPLRVPIDSAYHSAGLVTTDLHVGPDVGSDHLPIVLTVRRRAESE